VAAVVLALAAAGSWGIADFVAGFQARRRPVLVVIAYSIPSGFLVLGSILLIRFQAPPSGEPILYAALAGVAGAVGIAAFYRGLAVGTMGVVAPISALAPLVPLAVGLSRGERPSTLQLIGICIALVGVALAGWEPAGGGSRIALGVGFALLAAACFGLALLGIDAASGDDPYWAATIVRASTAVVTMVAVAAVRPPLRTTARSVLPLLLIGIFDASATMAFAVASTRGLVAVVAVVGSLYPVVIVVLARLVLRERLSRPQLAGAGSALGGVALISAG
jgi:drug/metabolite transporter (DMT)-like permease